MGALATFLYVVSAVMVAYVYAGYPLMIWLLARLWPRQVAKADVTPSISIVIAVYNEEDFIETKIRNSLAVDYPHDKLEVLIVSDGSTDRTNTLTRRMSGPRVKLIKLARGGKAEALNAGAEAASGDILVLTDANVELARDSLRILASSFADPEVGGVSGKKRYYIRHGSDTTEQGENLYWRWDQWQKELESTFGSMFAADGTLYAIRRALYVPIQDPAQADDIAISTRVVLQGYRLVFDPTAKAFEEAPKEGADEFRRKVRVTNHSVRALLNLGAALWTSGFYSVELLSHKLLRHLVPFFLVLLLLSNVLLARGSTLAWGTLALQILFYVLAITGAALRHRRTGAMKVFSVPYYFCLVNAAALLGVLSILRGRRVAEWSPRGT
ncbi:MAG TPA: glycosyltransferase family 2 protein [Thermoanaerobaculia bacterium]|nr:glycosyltransferase family 2 protein [Thermoanaerobaculia bacterium]